MDLQRQKLKNRLNLKFQPLGRLNSQRNSLKRLSIQRQRTQINTSKNKQSSIDKIQHSFQLKRSKVNRSTSNIRLPSIEKIVSQPIIGLINNQEKRQNNKILELIQKKQRIKSIQKLDKVEKNINGSLINHQNNISTIGNISKINYGINSVLSSSKIKDDKLLKNFKSKHQHLQTQTSKINDSIHQISPVKVKVQSTSSIHQTLTFLIKNQILNIPKIVALLQKSHSDQFLYMKVCGIYQYQVCDQHNKGRTFVTVSRNGMVIDGQLVPLQILIHQFEQFNKLKKIQFFKTYLYTKFMNKWHKGTKKAQFIQKRNKIEKTLNLKYKKLLKWDQQLKQLLRIQQNGGSFSQNWVNKIGDLIRQKKTNAQDKLARVCFQMLDKFNLPISQSTQLMNKVLTDFNSLNINFQTRIKIQKQIDIFYKFSRKLEFFFIYSISNFVIKHINTICDKIRKGIQQYDRIILTPLENLDINKDNYIHEKQKILVNSPLVYQINFQIYINSQTDQLEFHSNSQEFYSNIKRLLQQFFKKVQRLSFKLVRTQKFLFVKKMLERGTLFIDKNDQKPFTIKDYTKTLPQYQQSLKELYYQIQDFQLIINRRLALNKLFLQVYKQLKLKNSQSYDKSYSYEQFNNQLKYLSQKSNFCHNIHDGQYFIFGYLNQQKIKITILQQIDIYHKRIQNIIPLIIKKQKRNIQANLKNHLNIFSLQVTTPSLFIKVFNQCQICQLNLMDYSQKIIEIQRINQLYSKVYKKDLQSIYLQKSLLNELRTKINNFKQTKQNQYLNFRKILQAQKNKYIQKTQKLSLKEQCFYIINNQTDLQSITLKIQDILKFLYDINNQLNLFNQLENFYNIKQTSLPKLQILIVQYETLNQIWQIYKEYQTSINNYLKINIMNIKASQQLYVFQNYIRKLEKYIKKIDYFEICKFLIEKIKIYTESMHFISQIQSENLRFQDYQQMNKLITERLIKLHQKTLQSKNSSFASIVSQDEMIIETYQIDNIIDVKQLTLQRIINDNLYLEKNIIEEVTYKCRKQLQIKQIISEFEFWWKNIHLQSKTLEDHPLIVIFDDNDKIRKQIDEYVTILINVLNHKYGSFVRKQCTNHLKNMSNLAQMLRLAIQHQDKFLNLYPILTSKYAENQLLQQYKKFSTILTKNMKNLRVLIKPTEYLNQTTKNLLLNNIKNFDGLLKALSQFLQKKRIAFQRFYFLQDNEMLEVLVGSQNQANIFRMFEGVKGWLLDSEGVKIGVKGVGGEQLLLKGWVYKNTEPQIMFKTLQQSIKSNLNSMVRNILYSYQVQMKELKNLYKNIPWMCVYTVQLILYTKQIQLNCFFNNISFQLQKNLIKQSIRGSLSNPVNNSNYITLLLFLLDFTEQLERQQVTSVFHFLWTSFLKYYNEGNKVIMRSLGSQHIWGGQYQGLWNLMINTSQMRRVNACVLGNIKNSNGVLLQGPAGTGKTQSLKQLARCMAKYCVIFNCSNQVNIKTLQKLLSGLCYTSSWISFDEINRLTAQIMSVMAIQINQIKVALVSQKQLFNFMGKRIQIKKGVGIFATMNPIYLKRVKIPENLKSYFRINCVNMPDYKRILQIMLYSLNFVHAQSHSLKISRLFKNFSLQLGTHAQYDFGMRAMKTFIQKLAKYKTTNKKQQIAIYKALYQTFYSRLNPYDLKTFDKVVKDIIGLIPQDFQVKNKIQSIKQSTKIGVIIVGPTSCKSFLINQYLESFKNKQIDQEVYNLNSMPNKAILGQYLLGKWNPGFIQVAARKSLSNQNKNYFLVLDNKLKSQIIQNFNTLLDQSKLLTLSNGTRLKLQDNFKIIMQTPDLSMTSPATITRCHVVYVSNQDVNKQNLIASILPKLNNSCFQRIFTLLSVLNNEQILRIGKVIPLIWNIKIQYTINKLKKRVIDHSKVLELNQNQIKGLQKCISYLFQLFGFGNKAKGLLMKQNIIPLRQNAWNYYISYQRYQQGQFIAIIPDGKIIKDLKLTFIPTISSQFCKIMINSAFNLNQYILWIGPSMNGKSTAIKRSINSIIETNFSKQIKLLKIPLDLKFNSENISNIFYDKISTRTGLSNDKTIIYIDNLHMSIEESQQLLRFCVEYKKMINFKTKQYINFQNISIIADASYINDNKFKTRINSHFAQIYYPCIQNGQISSLFAKIIRFEISQTKTQTLFKQNLQIQMDKFTVFLVDYLNKKQKIKYFENKNELNNKFQQKNIKTQFSHFQMIQVLKNIKIINQKFVKQSKHFIGFMLSEIRKNDIELNTVCSIQKSKILDILKLSYHQSYKQKFIQEYNQTLKNSYDSHLYQNAFYSNFQHGITQKIISWDNFKNKIYKQLNEEYYLSEFMIQQMILIFRTLQYHGGNYILIGKQGLGKKSIFKMVSYLTQSNYINSQIIEKDKITDFYFQIIKQTFIKNKSTILTLDPSVRNFQQIMIFLQRIKSNYPIKFLFKNQDIEQALSLMQQYQNSNFQKNTKTIDSIVEDFFTYTSEKIHVFISCKKENFNQITSKYHYFMKSVSIRLVEDFPKESIIEISQKIISQKILQKSHSSSLSIVFLKLYQDLQYCIQENYKNKGYSYFKYNPVSHFKFIQKYLEVESQILYKLKQKQDILNRSIIKIQDIEQQIKQALQKIQFLQPQIKKNQQKLMQILPNLEYKQKIFQQIKQSRIHTQKEIQYKIEEIQQLKKIIEQQIIISQPIFKETNESLLSIKRGQISQFKNNPNPQPIVKFTFQCLSILLGDSDTWQTIKKNLSDPNLMLRIKNCNPKNQDINKLKKKIEENKQWNFQSVSKASFSIRYLYKWIVSILKYSQMKNSIDNNKIQLENLYDQLNKLNQQIQNKNSRILSQEVQYNKVEYKYKQMKNHIKELQQQLINNKRKISNAGKINITLQNYLKTWRQRIKISKDFKKNIIGISSIFTFYLKIYPFLQYKERKIIRQKLQQNLKKNDFKIDQSFNPLIYLKQKLQQNQNQLLISTRNSIENQKNLKFYYLRNLSYEDQNNQNIIFLLYNLQKKPILFDPDNQALKWLQTKFSQMNKQNQKLIITKNSFTSATKNVELAIKQGYFLIILIDDYFDQFTLNLINSKITQSGNRRLMQYNKNLIYVHQDFQLLFCNKNRRPNPSVSYFISYPVINFQITSQILKNQLLINLMKNQSQSIYKSKINLQIQIKTNNEELKNIEQIVINQLINNKKELIEDDQLIQLIQNGEIKTQQISINKQKMNQKKIIIEKYVVNFEKICVIASKMFESLKIMSRISQYYSWNAEIFTQYFLKACQFSLINNLIIDVNQNDYFIQNLGSARGQNYDFQSYMPQNLTNSRATSALSYVSNISDKILKTQSNQQNVQEQKKHQNLKIKKITIQQKQKIEFQDVMGQKKIMIDQQKKGIIDFQRQQKIIKKLTSYIKNAFTQQQNKTWALVLCLIDCNEIQINILFNQIQHKPQIKDYIEGRQITKRFKKYLNSLQDNADRIIQQLIIHPNPFSKCKENLQQIDILILFRLLKQQRFNQILLQLIKLKGYQSILQYEKVGAQDWFSTSDNIHPLLLMMGEDPLPKISQYIGLKKYKNVILLAMGQEQSKVAQIVIEKQSQKQNIVIIHNLHICNDFYPFLSKTLQQFQIKKPHKNFRLILISSLNSCFDISIASSCHKFYIKQPKGIKNQMKYLYENFPVDLIKIQHKKIGYSLCLFHSIINQLLKYKFHGWNTVYQFTTSDFINSIKVLKQILQNPLNLKNYICNIDSQNLAQQNDPQKIDFQAIKYLIGQVNYVGKLTNNFDRQKMRIYIAMFFNPKILQKNYRFAKSYQIPDYFTQQQLLKVIQMIPQNDPHFYGLQDNIKPYSQSSVSILKNLNKCYSNLLLPINSNFNQNKIQILPEINHPLFYINQQIKTFNQNLIQKIFLKDQNVQQKYQLLKIINKETKIFDLRSFLNPNQFFIEVRKRQAEKFQVQFEKIQLGWSLIPKQNTQCFGIRNLKLQSAQISKKEGNLTLQKGHQEENITLYFFAAQKKKKNQISQHKKNISIPLYMKIQRQGAINSFGDSTNLLTMVNFESIQSQQFWILRSTALIADPNY